MQAAKALGALAPRARTHTRTRASATLRALLLLLLRCWCCCVLFAWYTLEAMAKRRPKSPAGACLAPQKACAQA